TRGAETVAYTICTEIPDCGRSSPANNCSENIKNKETLPTAAAANNNNIQNTIKEMVIQMAPEIATKLIREWLNENLKNIDVQKMVMSVVEKEVRKLFNDKNNL
ncbi:MAG: DUF2497 domain-containing protein, partial [Holosporaceae bacterium]|nr:DUF2497 domain-containing protein [Holosporaceae bacterium]